MTWTYSGNPSSSDKDAVRVLIGDTDSTDPLLTDEEITYFVDKNSNEQLLAASDAAQAIAGKFARFMRKYVGDLRVFYGDRFKQYNDLSDSLFKAASVVTAAPYAGGKSVSEKQSVSENDDRVQPDFIKDQFDDTRIGPQAPEFGLNGPFNS